MRFLRKSDYILLTGPTKLFGNEVCKIDGGPSAKHEDRSQILQAEFPNNFVRLRSVRCFLHAAMPGAVFKGIRLLFRLKIHGLLDDDSWFTENIKMKTGFGWKLEKHAEELGPSKKKRQRTQRNATRHFDVIVELHYGYETGWRYQLWAVEQSNSQAWLGSGCWRNVYLHIGTCTYIQKWNAHCEM